MSINQSLQSLLKKTLTALIVIALPSLIVACGGGGSSGGGGGGGIINIPGGNAAKLAPGETVSTTPSTNALGEKTGSQIVFRAPVTQSGLSVDDPIIVTTGTDIMIRRDFTLPMPLKSGEKLYQAVCSPNANPNFVLQPAALPTGTAAIFSRPLSQITGCTLPTSAASVSRSALQTASAAQPLSVGDSNGDSAAPTPLNHEGGDVLFLRIRNEVRDSVGNVLYCFSPLVKTMHFSARL